MMNNKLLFFSILVICFSKTKAQELTPEQVVSMALEHNYGIKVANNNASVAKNNADLLNSGYLPVVTANANSYYNIDDAEVNFNDGSQTNLTGAESSSYSASIDVNYTLFDGFGRSYNYKQLKEQKQLSEIQARETIENTVLQLFTVYYTLAEVVENKDVISETLKISKDRLKRANYQFEYGQTSKLEVLNAEVDINNDSISFMNSNQNVINYKRDLNLVLGNSLSEQFGIDTEIDFDKLYNKDELLQKAKTNNVSWLQVEKNLQIANLGLKSNQATYLPTIGLVGSYGWNKANNNSASFSSSSINTGLTGGLTLSWSLFDGGSTLTKVRNSKLEIDSKNIQKKELAATIERDFNNAWDDFQNKLNIYKLQEQNIKTAENNFNRTQEKFKLGQVNSIDFRQAQLNLLNARLGENQAKYQAKLAELTMLQICGEILNSEF